MIMVCGILALLVVAALGCYKRQSLPVTILVVFGLWILMGLNTMNADYAQYQYLYDFRIEDATGVNFGYLAAERLAWTLELDFLQFRMLYSAAGLLLLALFVRRYSSVPNVVLVLYGFLPFMYDIVQFKFFMAAAVAVYSMRFLIDRTRLFGLKFGVGLLVATLVHPAAFLFIAFAIGLLERHAAFKVSLLLSVLILFAVYSGVASFFASFVMGSAQYETYMSELGRFGWIPYLVSSVGAIALAYFSSHLRNRDCAVVDADGGEARYIRFFESAKYAFLLLAALLPLSVQNFYRPLRVGNILLLMHLSSFVFGRRGSFPKNEKAALVALAILWFIFTQIMLYQGVLDIVVAEELSNNLLWE